MAYLSISTDFDEFFFFLVGWKQIPSHMSIYGNGCLFEFGYWEEGEGYGFGEGRRTGDGHDEYGGIGNGWGYPLLMDLNALGTT
jgi:hypothetical protein